MHSGPERAQHARAVGATIIRIRVTELPVD